MSRTIAVTFDYRCPFAYNGHASMIAAVRGGADLDFRAHAFSLDQVHVPEGEAPIWERPSEEWTGGVVALLYGITVRDHFPDQFDDAHLALFGIRHEQGQQLEEDAIRDAIGSCGLDVDAVAAEAWSGRPLEALAAEHTEAVDRWAVFGVPTFIEGENAAFVRFMERGKPDDIERMLTLLDWVEFNEFKRPTVPR